MKFTKDTFSTLALPAGKSEAEVWDDAVSYTHLTLPTTPYV